MLNNETVVISTALWLTVLLATSLAQESGDSACTELPERNQTAYIGWPVIIDGGDVGFHYDFYEEEDYDDGNDAKLLATMTFKGSNKPFYNLTHGYNDDHGPKGEISNVTTATPTRIEVKVQELTGSSCVTQTVILQPTHLPDLSCESASNNTKLILKRDRIEGGQTVVECAVHDEGEPELDIGDKYNVTWYFNCDTKLPPNITVLHNKLHFFADHTQHPGIYSCSIQQSEQERFLVANHFCVKPNAWSSLVSLICPKTITLDEGDTVKITCDVSVAETGIDSHTYHMTFYPLLGNGSKDFSKDDISCTSSLGRNRTFAEDEQASCIFSYVLVGEDHEFKCFDYIPTRLEWEKEKNKTLTTLRMSYELKNWEIGDLIILQSCIHNKISGKDDFFNTTIKVQRHPERTALIIGCTVGGFLLILFVVALCFLFQLQIRYWWRQTSCVKYENDADVRKFGAYFTYYWENDAGERTENSQYQQLILSMRKHLSKINCPIYDNHESPALFKCKSWSEKNTHQPILTANQFISEARVTLHSTASPFRPPIACDFLWVPTSVRTHYRFVPKVLGRRPFRPQVFANFVFTGKSFNHIRKSIIRKSIIRESIIRKSLIRNSNARLIRYFVFGCKPFRSPNDHCVSRLGCKTFTLVCACPLLGMACLFVKIIVHFVIVENFGNIPCFAST